MECHSEPILRRSAGAPPPSGVDGQDDESGRGSRRTLRDTLRLLIVEDETFVALDVEQTLQGAGYEVVGLASSADEAIQQAAALRPDMILMDIRLLGQRDGVDAAVEIYERFGIRCLFASAHADAETRSRAAAAQPLGFLSKPFTRKALVDAVASHADLL